MSTDPTTWPMPGLTWRGASDQNCSQGRQGRSVLALVNHLMMGTLESTAQWFTDPQAQVSSHFGIGSDGRIFQFVHLGDTAYANGNLRQPNLMAVPWLKEWAILRGVNPNRLTVSIEWEGRHEGLADTKVTYSGATLDSLKASSVAHYWSPTPDQYQAGKALNGWLCQMLGLHPSRATITRHSDYDAVTRWYCPGPMFPNARLITDLGGVV